VGADRQGRRAPPGRRAHCRRNRLASPHSTAESLARNDPRCPSNLFQPVYPIDLCNYPVIGYVGQMGRPRASALLPLLRSDALARVLAAILLAPDSLHLRALADRTQLPYSVVQREVDRLESSGLVTSTRFANSRLVRPNEHHPLFHELRALLLKAYGPRDVLEDLLREEEGIRNAFIFGSWAARYQGDWGSLPADIDVLVVGRPSISRIEEIEAEAEDMLGQPVQIQVVPETEWQRPTEGFTRTVQKRPLVPLFEEND
jgi:predicted nucleotidyltransferase